MTANKIKERIGELASHLTFEYQGISCGIDPVAPTHFDVWCGEDMQACHSLDEVMGKPIFLGHTLLEIYGDIEIIDW